MSKNSFKAKNGLTVVPVDPATIVNPEAGDIIADSTDSNKIKQYNPAASMFEELGGGAGGINYLTNPDAETGTTGWVTYADVAQAQPVDGVAGSPAITLTATTVSPLRGLRSFLLSKGALNEIGEGTSVPFTIDPADRASILRVSFDYSSTTNYLDGDVRVYVYDITNSRLIEVVDRDVKANAQGKYVGTFQSSPDSVSYRLILHVASTNALAWDLEFDNVIVGPREIVRGPVMTDWQSYTAQLVTATGAAVTNVSPAGALYRRVGDSIQIRATFNFTGTPAAFTELEVTLPPGIVLSTDFNAEGFSSLAGIFSNNVGAEHSLVGLQVGNRIRLRPGYVNTLGVGAAFDPVLIGNVDFKSATYGTIVSGNAIRVNSEQYRVLGWSSNATLSEDAGNREIAAKFVSSVTQSIPQGTWTIGDFNGITATFDTSASFIAGSSRFVAPESGYYEIIAEAGWAASGLGSRAVGIAVNGAGPFETMLYQPSGSDVGPGKNPIVRFLNKGDFVQIMVYQSGQATLNSTLRGLTITKRSSPQTIAASEVVACRYVTNAAQSIPTSVNVTVVYEDRLYDTHNAYNPTTGVFTAPQSGYYSVDAGLLYQSAAWPLGSIVSISALSPFGRSVLDNKTITAASTNFFGASGSDTVFLAKGQTLRIDTSHTRAANTSIITDNAYNYISITKVG